MIINTLIIIFWLLVIIYILIESYIYGPLTVLCGCVLASIIVIAGIKIVTGIAPKDGNGKDHTFEIPKSQYNSIKPNSRVLCKINYKENKITKIKMIDKSRILYNPFVQKLR